MSQQKKTDEELVKGSDEEVQTDTIAPESKSDLDPKKQAEVPDLFPEATHTPAQTTDDTTPFDDAKTDAAINDIVAKESDEVLAAEDAAAARATPIKGRRHGFFAGWWYNKWTRWITVFLILGGVVALLAAPATRYRVLTAVGVRVKTSVVVVDEKTKMPLKGVQFAVGTATAITDSQGRAKIQQLKLGPQTLTIKQNGFANVKRTIILGWGSNPLGTVALKAVGVRYEIETRDYVSDKPIAGVEATNGEAVAVSDATGKIILTLPNSLVGEQIITLTKVGYRTEKVTLSQDPKEATKAVLVLAQKAVFVSKQSGKYDVYKSDIDGKNKELLLAGTGKETSNISLVVSPDGSRAALVSTRTDNRDAEGSLLSSLVLITIQDGSTVTIVESPQIELIDWIGFRLVFEQVSSDSSANNRYKVIAYNYKDNSRVQLAAANKLDTVVSAQGAVYYVVAPGSSDDSAQAGLFKIAVDATGKQLILQGEVWSVLRTAYDTLQLQLGDGTWKSYAISSGAVTQVEGSSLHKLYIDNPIRTKSLWINQTNLTSYDVATAKDLIVKTDSALAYPLRWLTDTTALYRLSVQGEVADYAFSIEGGTAHKVADVASTYGFAQGQ